MAQGLLALLLLHEFEQTAAHPAVSTGPLADPVPLLCCQALVVLLCLDEVQHLLVPLDILLFFEGCR